MLIFPLATTNGSTARCAVIGDGGTRRLALDRAHGLAAKVSRRHRWMLTVKGRRLISAPLAARNASTDRLGSLAA